MRAKMARFRLVSLDRSTGAEGAVSVSCMKSPASSQLDVPSVSCALARHQADRACPYFCYSRLVCTVCWSKAEVYTWEVC
jgi:hypothetical protein